MLSGGFLIAQCSEEQHTERLPRPGIFFEIPIFQNDITHQNDYEDWNKYDFGHKVNRRRNPQ